MAIPTLGAGGDAKRERYFFRSVSVPPTSVTPGEEYTRRPGIAEAASDNMGDGVVVPGGQYLQTGDDPTVHVKIVGYGTRLLDRAAHKQMYADLRRGAVPGPQAAAHWRELSRQVEMAGFVNLPGRPAESSVLRFEVRRTGASGGFGWLFDDAAYAGVVETWDFLGHMSVRPSSDYTDDGAWDEDWRGVGHPVMIETVEGWCLAACLVQKTGETDVGLIVGMRRPGVTTANQSYWGGFEVWAEPASNSLQTLLGNADAHPVDLAVLRRGAEVYGIIACDDRRGPGHKSMFYVVRLYDVGDPAANTLALYSGPHTVNTDTIRAITACAHGDGALVVIDGGDALHTLLMAQSTDLRTFPQVSTDVGLVDLSRAWPVPKRGRSPHAAISAMHWLSVRRGVACSTSGTVCETMDGGRTWEEIRCPFSMRHNAAKVSYPLYDIHAVADGETGDVVVYAVGYAGIAKYRSATDDGFKIIWLQDNGLVEDFYAADLSFTRRKKPAATKEMGNPLPHCCWFADTDTGWIAGSNGILAATTDGGATWTRVLPVDDEDVAAGAWLTMHVDGAASRSILLGGGSGCMDSSVSDEEQTCRIALLAMTDATTIASRTNYLPTDAVDDHRVCGFTRSSGLDGTSLSAATSTVYALTDTGQILTVVGDDAGGLVVTSHSQLTPKTPGYLGISCPDDSDFLAVAGPSAGSNGRQSLLWLCRNATSAKDWSAQLINDVIGAIHFTTSASGMGALGGARHFWQVRDIANILGYPALLTLDTGNILLAYSDLTLGTVQLYVGSPGAGGAPPHFTEVENGVLRFSAAAAATEAYRVCLTQMKDGRILLRYGKDTRIGLQGGRYWVNGSAYDNLLRAATAEDPGLSLTPPSLAAPPAVTADGQGWRQWGAICCFGPNMVYSMFLDDTKQLLVQHELWGWSAQNAFAGTTKGTGAMPIFPGVPCSAGTHGLSLTFQGNPQVGDEWTIHPAHDYPASNVVVESPSVLYRSKTAGAVTLEWDRQASAVTALLGSEGKHWHITACALFGTNFRAATFRLSSPAADAVWSSRQIAVSELGIANLTVIGVGGQTSTILQKTGASWVPHRWRPRGSWRWMLSLGDTTFVNILDSTHDCLIVDKALPVGTTYGTAIVFPNRMLFDGLTIDSGPAAAGLRDTIYRFGRTFQIVIAANSSAPPLGNPSATAVHEIGTALIAVEPELTGDERGYDHGIRWRPVPSTAETTGVSGVKTVRQYGVGQLWEMTYLEDKDPRDRKLNALLGEMRQPFALLFQGDDERGAATLELVRLVDTATFHHVVRDVFESEQVLEEVV